jgi:hypothetical protein
MKRYINSIIQALYCALFKIGKDISRLFRPLGAIRLNKIPVAEIFLRAKNFAATTIVSARNLVFRWYFIFPPKPYSFSEK